MKRRIIKIEKRELHINQMNIIIMRNRQERLNKLYVFIIFLILIQIYYHIKDFIC